MMKKLLFVIFSLIISVNAYCQVNLDNGLVAAYSFSGNASDTTRNGFNGTISGATLAMDRFSCSNSSYHFANANDYIDLQDILDTVFAGSGSQFSISVWIKPDLLMSNNFIIGKVADGGCSEDERQFYFRVLSQKIGFSYNMTTTNANSGRGILGSTPITDTTKWYHVVITYDGTINTNNGLDRVKIYVNNSLDVNSFDSSPPAVPLGDIPNGTAPLTIGNNLSVEGTVCGSGNGHFYGKLDDILFYNRLLTADEVTALYNILGGTCTVTAVTNATAQTSGITLYPNPADLSVIVTVNQQGSYSYELVTPEGIMVSSGTLSGTIDISGLQKGIYIVKINGNNGSFAQKLIKN